MDGRNLPDKEDDVDNYVDDVAKSGQIQNKHWQMKD